ncbi:MAG: hypothetical protein JO211_00180, partial [Acidobacteriaceae bacterium]|nr:hypothetical protein [Acidobacteriaceae bacterium]
MLKKGTHSVINFDGLEVWFVTGSQHLYGKETLQKVQEHSDAIARELTNT